MRAKVPVAMTLALALAFAVRGHGADSSSGEADATPADASHQATFTAETTVSEKKEDPYQQRVGVTVTTFAQPELERLDWRKPAEVVSQVPNAVVKETFGNANPIFVIRGVGTNDFNANTSPSTGLNVDEVPLVAPLEMGFVLFDVEHVEVVKGPQGTLYGRNTTAGAINVLTQRPSTDREQRLRLGAERYHTGELELEAGGRLGGDIGGRLAIDQRRSTDGPFYNRTYGERRGAIDVLGGRVGLDWEHPPKKGPSTAGGTSMRLSLHGGRDRSEGYQYEHLGFLDPVTHGPCAAFLADRADPEHCVDLAGYSDPDGDPFTGDWNLRPRNYLSSLGGVATVEHQTTSKLDVVAITGWERFDRRQWLDADASPDVGLDVRFETEIEQLSQEIRVRGGEGTRFGWLLGAFAGRDHLRGDPNQLFLLDDWLATRAAVRWDQRTTSLALFGSGEWRIGDKLVLTTGARYTAEEKQFRGSTTDLNPFGTSCFLSPTCSPGFVGPVVLSSTDRTLRSDHLSPEVRLEYFASERSLFYGSVREGFKSGGFNGGFAASDFELEPYHDERVVAYEGGVKLDRGPFAFDVAAFHYDYRDLQLFAVRTSAAGLPTVVLTNASDARVSGTELEARLRPFHGFEARAGMGLLSTELVHFDSLGRDLSGNELPNAPHQDYNALIAWRHPFGAQADALSLSADYSYTGATFKEPTNFPVFRGDAYGLLGARIQVERGRVSLALWGKNLTDERYLIDAFDQSALGQSLRVYGWPRTYGVSVAFRR